MYCNCLCVRNKNYKNNNNKKVSLLSNITSVKNFQAHANLCDILTFHSFPPLTKPTACLSLFRGLLLNGPCSGNKGLKISWNYDVFCWCVTGITHLSVLHF